MTQRDKWLKPPRPIVQRYFDYRDFLRLVTHNVDFPGALSVEFYLPMPKSWSKRKKEKMEGKPHLQRPDIDNLLKGLLDAIFEEDCAVYSVRAKKFWSEEGAVWLAPMTVPASKSLESD